jgi:hypothetical protein
MIKSALPQRGFLYAHNDALYAANSFHVDGRELSELIAKLPGKTAPQPPLERTLPSSLRGVALERSSFAGDQWLRASPEAAFQPELRADIPAMLTELDAPASALTVAWATAPDGPKVVAYQITGVDGDTLRRSFLHSIPARRTTPKRLPENGSQSS